MGCDVLLCFGSDNFDGYYEHLTNKLVVYVRSNYWMYTVVQHFEPSESIQIQKWTQEKEKNKHIRKSDELRLLCVNARWSLVRAKVMKNLITKISLSPHLLHFAANLEIVNFDLICYNIYFSHRIIIVSAHMYYIIELTRKIVVCDPQMHKHTFQCHTYIRIHIHGSRLCVCKRSRSIEVHSTRLLFIPMLVPLYHQPSAIRSNIHNFLGFFHILLVG